MSQLKQCDRCEKIMKNDLEISTTIEMFRFSFRNGHVRPGQKLREAGNLEYLPFKLIEPREFDLCEPCFQEFMVFPSKEVETPLLASEEKV